MRKRLAAGGDRFGCLVESIVTSPQFRNRRVDTGLRRNQDHERIRAGRGTGPADTRTSRRTSPGRGRTMALPWLESVPGLGCRNRGRRPARPLPEAVRRHVHGLWRQLSQLVGQGLRHRMELGRCLEPLAPLKTKINVVNGLFNRPPRAWGSIPVRPATFSQGRLQKGAELKGGISIDQELAKHLGENTVQPSMVLGCEQPITGYHETNFSMAYSSHISWQSATSPVPMEVYPSLAFDSLFDNRGSQRNQSILDRVREEAAGLSRRVSSSDRAKLDEYLTSVREVEKRAARCDRPRRRRTSKPGTKAGRPSR